METGKCPNCNATVEKDVTLCGNCKSRLVWKDGEPKIDPIEVLTSTGKAFESLGCLLTLVITIPIILIMAISL